MWTAQIQQINKDSEKPTAVVLFTDGVKYKRLETINLTGLTEDTFKQTVEGMRLNFEKSFKFVDLLEGNFDFTILSSAPTKEELAKNAYLLSRASLIDLKTDMQLGLATQEAFDTALAETLNLQSAF